MKSIFVFLSFLMLAACSPKAKFVSEHTSRNSVDWTGMYVSTPEPQKTIVLKKDLRFEMETNGKREEGQIIWFANGNNIALRAKKFNAYYKVGENVLFETTKRGKMMNNKLEKQSSDQLIQEKYWKLVSLGDKKVEPQDNEPHIILKENNEFKGNGTCNKIFGKYELNESENKLNFTMAASTRKRCNDNNLENDFLKVLRETNHYSINFDVLLLKQNDKTLARLEAVYLR